MSMFGTYEDKMYRLKQVEKECYLRTVHEEKADKRFHLENERLYTLVVKEDDAKLTEIYDATIWVVYDTGDERLEKEWKLDLLPNVLLDGKVRLIHAGGRGFEGFVQCDVAECYKYVDIEALQGAYVCKIYRKKEGEKVELTEKEAFDPEKLEDQISYYTIHNV